MKKAIFSMVFTLCSTMAVNAQEATSKSSETLNPNGAEITFVSEVIDYGAIEHNADGNREFKFKNTGKEPLIITDCQKSCGCTIPNWPKEPIKPGASGTIKVHYATDRIGQFEKMITVVSNAKIPSKVIRIKGLVKADTEPSTVPNIETTIPNESH